MFYTGNANAIPNLFPYFSTYANIPCNIERNRKQSHPVNIEAVRDLTEIKWLMEFRLI